MSGRQRLRVDWPSCRAHEICAQVLPELITLDEWGYPVVEGQEIPDPLRRRAVRAANACPSLALRLVPAFT